MGQTNLGLAGIVIMAITLAFELMMRVRFPLPAPDADIAQLVERTLGKGGRRFKSAYQHQSYNSSSLYQSANKFIG